MLRHDNKKVVVKQHKQVEVFLHVFFTFSCVDKNNESERYDNK